MATRKQRGGSSSPLSKRRLAIDATHPGLRYVDVVRRLESQFPAYQIDQTDPDRWKKLAVALFVEFGSRRLGRRPHFRDLELKALARHVE